MLVQTFSSVSKIEEKFCQKVENLYSTDEREASQKAKGSTYSWELISEGSSNILGDNIKCWSVNVDANDLVAVFPLIAY